MTIFMKALTLRLNVWYVVHHFKTWKAGVSCCNGSAFLSQENMDEVCSLQLLTSVRRMVLTLTQQNDESKMFVRFFHRQLGGILQVWREPNTNSLRPENTNASKANNNPPLKTFHLPLLLQDSLSKFVGRTLKDCGEDLLVEISEILFNELAFFRLMQDLDNSNSISTAAKHKSKRTNELPSKEKQSLKVFFQFGAIHFLSFVSW